MLFHNTPLKPHILSVCCCCLIMHETLRQIPSHYNCTHKVHTQTLVDWRQRRLPSSTCDKHKHYSKQPAGPSFASPRGSTPRAAKGQREQTSVRKLNAAVQEVINRRLSQLTEIVSPALSPLAKLKRKWGRSPMAFGPDPVFDGLCRTHVSTDDLCFS